MERVPRFPLLVAVAGLLVALGLCFAVGPSVAPAKQSVAQKAKKKPKKKPAKKPLSEIRGLYNSRYCEIFGVNAPDDEGIYELEVFNTVGLNRCPDQQWEAMDLPGVAAENGWFVAARNGPRFWVMDRIRGAKPPASVLLGDLRMRKVAVLRLPALAQTDFQPFVIERRTQWIYNKGRYIRELISPNGRRYVMQAYTRNVDADLDEASLNRIGSNPLAAIPEGWTFRYRKLKRQLVLTANGKATILRDGLRSVYQLVR